MASGDDYATIWLPNREMRERATVPSTTLASLGAIRGFMRPRYIEVMEDGRRVGELRQADIQRVADGYACGECFAYFDRRYNNCPGCGHELDPNLDIVEYLPDHWKPSPSRTSDEILAEPGIPESR